MENLDNTILMTYGVVFAAVGYFTYLGIDLFSKGWQSYEEKYLEDAEKSLEAMFLTIPPQHLLYLSFLLFFLATGMGTFVMGQIGSGLALGAISSALPTASLRFLKRRRERRFREQLVGALQCLASSLKAGFTLPKAFEQLEKEAKNPMRQEVRILLQEQRLGTTVERAVENLHERMPSEDMDLIANSVAIANKVGGNLPLIFKQLEETIRERMRVEGKVRALTAQGRFQAIVIGLLPAFVLVSVNVVYPELLQPLFTTLIGWVILATVVVLDLIGYLMIRKIVNIEI